MTSENVNSFPLDALPTAMRVIATDLNKERHFPISYLGAIMLYATSVAIGSTVTLRFPAFDNIYANLSVALVGTRGSNKSAPITALLRPLKEIDHNNCQQYNAEIRKYESLTPEQKNQLGKPSVKRILVSDSTIETLCQLLDTNKRGLGLFVDELTSWIGGFDRYRKSSSRVDESFYLSIYNCSPITIDRSSRSTVISIKKPFLSVIGSIQPSTLIRNITKDRIENGFFDRLLLANYEGPRFEPWTEDSPTEYISLSQWKELITRVYNLSLEYTAADKEQTMECHPQALKWIIDWRNTIEEENALNSTTDVQALFKKTQVYCLRILIIINIFRYVSNEIHDPTIADLKSAISATTITDWFYKNSKKFLMENIKTNYTTIQANFVNHLPEDFYTKDAKIIGETYGMKERTVELFLSNQQGILFEKLSHGHYRKF